MHDGVSQATIVGSDGSNYLLHDKANLKKRIERQLATAD
jgi:hypothetical protein